MLELKHVSYSYQSYQEEIFSDVNYQFENGTLQHYQSVWSRKSTSSPLLAGLDNPQKKFRFSLMGGHQSATTTTSCFLVLSNYNLIDYLTPLECAGQQTSWKRFS